MYSGQMNIAQKYQPAQNNANHGGNSNVAKVENGEADACSVDIMDAAASMGEDMEKVPKIQDPDTKFGVVRGSFEVFMLKASVAIQKMMGDGPAPTPTAIVPSSEHSQIVPSSSKPVTVNVDPEDILSFWYQAEFQFRDLTFHSIGQAYKFVRLLQPPANRELAFRIRGTKDPVKAFSAAEEHGPSEMDGKWPAIRESVFFEIAKAFAEQVPEFSEALRKHGPGTKYLFIYDLSQCGCSGGGKQNQYGVWLSKFADLYLKFALPNMEDPLKSALACCQWEGKMGHANSDERKVLVIADRELQDIDSGSSYTRLVIVPQLTAGPEQPHAPSLRAVLQRNEDCLPIVDYIIIAATEIDVTRNPTEIGQLYSSLLAWLLTQCKAWIYLVSAYPRLKEGTWDRGIYAVNSTLERVCAAFSQRVSFLDVCKVIKEQGTFADNDAYRRNFLSPRGIQLHTFGRRRFACLIMGSVPICYLRFKYPPEMNDRDVDTYETEANQFKQPKGFVPPAAKRLRPTDF